MSIHVIGTVLCIIFNNQDRCVVPVRTVRDRLRDASQSEIVVGNVLIWSRLAGAGSSRVVVRQVEKHERREGGALAFF